MAALGDQSLQAQCIALDPYAILANGDPSQLSSYLKSFLIEKLHALSEVDPYFRRSDACRRFSVAGFFDDTTLGLISRQLISDHTSMELRDLFLELLQGAESVKKLIPELRQFLLDSNQPRSTRMRAQRLLLDLPGHDHRADFAGLVAMGDSLSLRLAAEGALLLPSGTLARQDFLDIITASGGKAEKSRRNDEHYNEQRYFVDTLVSRLPLDEVVWLLDAITPNLCCSCGAKNDYDCECLPSISRIVAKLLDRYFSIAPQPHDPCQIWNWIKPLRFRRQATADKSLSIATLKQDAELRQSIQRIAFADCDSADRTWKTYVQLSLSRMHSGLSFSNADQIFLLEHAFDTDNAGLWAGLYTRHHRWNTGPGHRNELRTRMRAHTREKDELLRVWAKCEHDVRISEREDRRRWPNRRGAFERREARNRDRDKTFFVRNRETIIAGKHWGALRWIADQYLMKPENLSDFLEDVSDADQALRNSFEFLRPHLPTLSSLVETKHRVVRVLHAATLSQFRFNGSLDGIDRDMLLAVKTDFGGYNGYQEGEFDRFEATLNSYVFPTTDEAEKFARIYLQPQMTRSAESATDIYALNQDPALQPIKFTLAVAWLDQFPDMPRQARDTLFDICASELDRASLIQIIEHNCAVACVASTPTNEENSTRDFWFLQALFFLDSPPQEVWARFRSSPDALFMIESRAGRFWRSENPTWPELSAEKIYHILDMYIDAWPWVELPGSYGTGDPPEETAYRFLSDIVWHIDRDDPVNSIPVLDRLLADPRFDEFRSSLLSQRASATRKDALRDFTAPLPAEIVGMLDDRRLATVEAFRALVVEELEAVEQWVRHNETNPLRTFYENSKHVDENTARDRIVDRLQARMSALNLSVNIERFMANQNRCDITVSAMIGGKQQLLVIEVKGQWNKELYSAASSQLFERCSMHLDAAGQGIYLALWFGPDIIVAGKKSHSVASSGELRDSIAAQMPKELHGRIDVVAINLEAVMDWLRVWRPV